MEGGPVPVSMPLAMAVAGAALVAAVMRNDEREALRLIEAGADVNAADSVSAESGGACGDGRLKKLSGFS